MKLKKPKFVIVGVVLLVAGVLSITYSLGWINFNFASTMSTTAPGQNLGLMVSTNTKILNPPLSVVTSGNTFKWSVTSTNTGTMEWDSGWVNIRMGINGATAVDTNCNTNPSSCATGGTVFGNFKVESCSYGIDVVSCREQIVSTWGLKYSDDNGQTWKDCPDYHDKVCSIDIGVVPVGEAKTIQLRLTIPSTVTSGSYPLITQALAWNGVSYAIAGTSDTLTVGSISGEITLEMIGGVAMSIIGMALLGVGI